MGASWQSGVAIREIDASLSGQHQGALSVATALLSAAVIACTACAAVYCWYCCTPPVLLCMACTACCTQDALNDAEDIKSVESERNGIKFYDYEIASPVRTG